MGERDLGSYFDNYIYLLLNNKKQEKLFNEYPANKKLVIDSVEMLEVLNEI